MLDLKTILISQMMSSKFRTRVHEKRLGRTLKAHKLGLRALRTTRWCLPSFLRMTKEEFTCVVHCLCKLVD